MERKPRGFVTIATGKDEYFVLARNLLASYRFHTQDPLPFAIICDRENAWTNDFDDVVFVNSPKRSFADKLRILDLSPYDETIFIDADCLAYSDLNGLWQYFEGAPPFCVLGDTLPPDSDQAWLRIENAGVFKDRLDRQMVCQGGVYYVRKDCPEEFKETVGYVFEHYDDFKFKGSFGVMTCDETIFTLACAVHRFYPLFSWHRVFAYYPVVTRIDRLDIRTGTLEYAFKWQTECQPDNGRHLFHWGMEHTRDWLYFREVERLRSASKGRRFNPVRPAFQYVRTHLKLAVLRILPYNLKVYFFKRLHPPKPEEQ